MRGTFRLGGFAGIILLVSIFIFLVSCNNKPSSGTTGTGNSSPPGVVFTADKDQQKTEELYSASLDGSEIIKLSGPLVPGGLVLDFQVSPDGTYVAYLADQVLDETYELYVVKVAGGTPVKVSGPLVPGGDVVVFAWAPDSSRIAYIADQETDGIGELYTNLPDGSNNTKVSGALVLGGSSTHSPGRRMAHALLMRQTRIHTTSENYTLHCQMVLQISRSMEHLLESKASVTSFGRRIVHASLIEQTRTLMDFWNSMPVCPMAQEAFNSLGQWFLMAGLESSPGRRTAPA